VTGGSQIGAQVTDEALVALVLGGDANAFAPLVERHKRGIVNFIYASVRSVEDANDLGQETFMRAYAHLRTFNPAIAKFSTWLYQIARNVARTHLGKESRRPQQEDLFEDETIEQRLPDTRREASPEAMALSADEDRAVREALANVPEKMRAALALRYFKHMEYQEIADTMQVSLGNVKTLIHRGKAALARALEGAQTGKLQRAGAQLQTEVANRELLCM
jgi:RNA polymerase sigma-70 factor (ECF subfamily)